MPLDNTHKLDLAKEIRKWRECSAYAVDRLFNAGLTPEHPDYIRPDPAQRAILELFDDPSKQRIALKACKGPGKTTTLAWCCWIFLATREHCNIAACSITRENLRDNLWKEMSKWYLRSPYLQAMFTVETTRIFSKRFKETWWMSARSWAKSSDKTQQDNALAGLHAEYTMAVLDESGGIPDGVMATADGTLSTVGGEHRILQAGNPTHIEGPLYRACTVERHLWSVIEITGDPDDPQRSPRISIEWARQQIERYGRDNPWVLVNVFGKFPSASINSLLGPDDLSEAMLRTHHETAYNHEAKILGVDVGYMGGDRTVLFPRQGLQAFRPEVLRPNRAEKNWTGKVVARIVQGCEKWGADMVCVDDTGGWAKGIIDGCRESGVTVVGVPFSGSAIDPRYKNRRAEMHFKAAEWVRGGGALPNMPELSREATATTYSFPSGKFLLEEKSQVRDKLGGESPDLWDAFVLTFAQPVIAKTGIPWLDAKMGKAKIEPDEEAYE